MSANFMPAGAWLSGAATAGLAANTPVGPSLQAGNTPIGPTFGVSLTPIGPTPSGHTPIGPTGPKSTTAPTGRWPVPTPAPIPLPWDGIDPRWVYSDASAMLGQALRKTRAKILHSSEDGISPDLLVVAAQRGVAVRGSHLWRWAPEFRISAVQCELLGRFQVLRSTVWMIDPGADETPTPTASKVFEICRPRGPDLFSEQIDKVQRAAAEREDRLPEILSQADDFWPFFESIIGICLANAPRLSEWLSVTQATAIQLLMAVKNGVAARRPVQCSSLVMPVIPTPGHGSLPSGHATISALNAEMLRTLLYPGQDAASQQRSTELDRLARRIAYNRVVAGVHFPFDSLVGYCLGTQLARQFIALAEPGRPSPALVDDTSFDAVDRNCELKETDGPRLAVLRADACTPAPQLAELWKRTREEVAMLRI